MPNESVLSTIAIVSRLKESPREGRGVGGGGRGGGRGVGRGFAGAGRQDLVMTAPAGQSSTSREAKTLTAPEKGGGGGEGGGGEGGGGRGGRKRGGDPGSVFEGAMVISGPKNHIS